MGIQKTMNIPRPEGIDSFRKVEDYLLRLRTALVDHDDINIEALEKAYGNTSADFVNGGEAGGAARTLGNTSAYSLGLITNDTNGLLISAAGEVTKPLTPCFLVVQTGVVTNVTGDGTAYSVVFNSEIFDQNADFSSTTFTAPVTGRYLFSTGIMVAGITGMTYFDLRVDTSNREYILGYGDADNVALSGTVTIGGSCIADMDATDTATVDLVIDGGAKVADINGDATYTRVYFSGNLLC